MFPNPITWLIGGGWQALLAGAVAGYLGLQVGRWQGHYEGRAAYQAEQSKIIREKLNDASNADDAARRCAHDPDCLRKSDGFKRD